MHMHKTEYRGAQNLRIVKFSSLCDPWHPQNDMSAKKIDDQTSKTLFLAELRIFGCAMPQETQASHCVPTFFQLIWTFFFCFCKNQLFLFAKNVDLGHYLLSKNADFDFFGIKQFEKYFDFVCFLQLRGLMPGFLGS